MMWAILVCLVVIVYRLECIYKEMKNVQKT